MAKVARKLPAMLGVWCALSTSLSFGRGLPLPMSLDFQSRLFDTEFIAAGPRALREAHLKSALGLTLGQYLLVDVDYHLTGQAAAAHPAGVLTQQLKTRVKSDLLDGLLGVDLGLDAASTFRDGGEIYQHRITPGLSRSFAQMGRFKLNYEYVLDKPSRLSVEQERRGYAMALDGARKDGRLSWSGSYRNTSVFQDRLIRTRASESLALKSRYRLASSLHLELSGALRNETRFTEEPTPRVYTQTRYGAALGWSPSARYSLAFRLDSLDAAREQRQDVFGSGSISWFVRPGLELKLDYGEQLVEGAPGWMLHTRFDLNG